MKHSAAELMELARDRSGERRRELMHRVADMYFQFSPRSDDPALGLFDDILKPVVVSFLNGQRSPTVESADADFNTLGIQLRGYHDFGCSQSEYLAGIKSKGAA